MCLKKQILKRCLVKTENLWFDAPNSSFDKANINVARRGVEINAVDFRHTQRGIP